MVIGKVICRNHCPRFFRAGFTLLEVVVVLGILGLLIGISVAISPGIGSKRLRVNADALVGLVEQARVHALTSRSYVVLAVMSPESSDNPSDGPRLGLFQIDEWPEPGKESDGLQGKLLKRWQSIGDGVILLDNNMSPLQNMLSVPPVIIQYEQGRQRSISAHIIAFHPRGTLAHPPGAAPVGLRLAEGHYVHGKPTPSVRGKSKVTTQQDLKIGRATGRAYLTES